MTKPKPAPVPPPPDLIAAMDDAIICLLKRAGLSGSDSVSGEGEAQAPSLADAVKVFEAAAKWAEQRSKMAPPPEPKRARVDVVREQFHRQTVGRGGGGASSAEPEGDE